MALTHLDSHGRDVFYSVVFSVSRAGPVLKTTVLDYRYGHYTLLGLTKDFVFVYDISTKSVSEYHLINVDREREAATADS